MKVNKIIDLPKILDESLKSVRVIYISSYIPRKCGIATFTKDLTTAINNQNPEALAEIIAISDGESDYDYPWEVKLRIRQDCLEDYLVAIKYINQSSTDIVVIEHEFGLYGGDSGDYVMNLLDLIEKPVITCLHSILPTPNVFQKKTYSKNY